MEFLDQLLDFLRQGINKVFEFVHQVWEWSAGQINQIPWGNIGQLELWEKLFLVVVAGVMIYLLYTSIRELLEAGVKALAAIGTLFSVLIKTVVPVLLAGLVAAGGAYVVNHF